MASTIPPRIAKTIAQKPEKTSAIATPPSRNAAPASVRTKPGARVLDRDLAQRVRGRDAPRAAGGGGDGELADRDAHGERRGQRDQRVPGREPGADLAAVDEDADDGVGERATGEQPERARDQRHQQRLARDQAAHLPWRRAERAQDGRLAPPLGDREGERAGDDEQGDRARDPAERPEDRDQPGAVGRGRVARRPRPRRGRRRGRRRRRPAAARAGRAGPSRTSRARRSRRSRRRAP